MYQQEDFDIDEGLDYGQFEYRQRPTQHFQPYQALPMRNVANSQRTAPLPQASSTLLPPNASQIYNVNSATHHGASYSDQHFEPRKQYAMNTDPRTEVAVGMASEYPRPTRPRHASVEGTNAVPRRNPYYDRSAEYQQPRDRQMEAYGTNREVPYTGAYAEDPWVRDRDFIPYFEPEENEYDDERFPFDYREDAYPQYPLREPTVRDSFREHAFPEHRGKRSNVMEIPRPFLKPFAEDRRYGYAVPSSHTRIAVYSSPQSRFANRSDEVQRLSKSGDPRSYKAAESRSSHAGHAAERSNRQSFRDADRLYAKQPSFLEKKSVTNDRHHEIYDRKIRKSVEPMPDYDGRNGRKMRLPKPDYY